MAPHARPLWFGGFIAAISAPIAVWTCLGVVEVVHGGSFVSDVAMRSLAVAMLYGVPICLVMMLVIGYPLALVLKKSGRLSAFNLSVGAVLAGAIVAIVASEFSSYGSFDIKLVIFGGAVGLFTAFVFCLVAGIPFRRTTP